MHPIVFFPLYEKMKIFFKNNYEDPNSTKLSNKYILLSTMISKIIASFSCYPHELLRARLQYETENGTTMRQLIKDIS